MKSACSVRNFTPRFTTGSQLILRENIPASNVVTAAQHRQEHKCDFWDTILVYNQ